MRVMEAALQYFIDLDAEIFVVGTFSANSCRVFKFSMIVAGEHFPFDETVEIDQIADHAGAADRPGPLTVTSRV